ncbi:hypothetical protein B488_10440 [Liberibacter crescens BT-1]|uniref:Uncharacterized protein n=1 Tax=Liberibacter crescens (strain BT-1) TaxID=1215343 RepID=L0EXE3_LIBCB|nr:hypothetical protein B488_10440 [Liberibacter crescens BT-1]
MDKDITPFFVQGELYFRKSIFYIKGTRKIFYEIHNCLMP